MNSNIDNISKEAGRLGAAVGGSIPYVGVVTAPVLAEKDKGARSAMGAMAGQILGSTAGAIMSLKKMEETIDETAIPVSEFLTGHASGMPLKQNLKNFLFHPKVKLYGKAMIPYVAGMGVGGGIGAFLAHGKNKNMTKKAETMLEKIAISYQTLRRASNIATEKANKQFKEETKDLFDFGQDEGDELIRNLLHADKKSSKEYWEQAAKFKNEARKRYIQAARIPTFAKGMGIGATIGAVSGGIVAKKTDDKYKSPVIAGGTIAGAMGGLGATRGFLKLKDLRGAAAFVQQMKKL